jgi:hypothetical protein
MAKLSFNRDRRSTSHFKTLSSFQKVDNLAAIARAGHRKIPSREIGGRKKSSAVHATLSP